MDLHLENTEVIGRSETSLVKYPGLGHRQRERGNVLVAFPEDPFSRASRSTGAAPRRGWQLEGKLPDCREHKLHQEGERGGIRVLVFGSKPQVRLSPSLGQHQSEV